MENDKSQQAYADKTIFSRIYDKKPKKQVTYIEKFNPNTLNYDLKEKGIVIVFSNKKYSDEDFKIEEKDRDIKNLINCFQKLNFNHKIYPDATKKDIENVINTIASRFELKDLSCLIIIVLTHGNSSKQLAAYDCNYDSSIFWQKLKGKLIGVPKIFIIQNCKNDCLNTEVSDKIEKTTHKFTVPEMADFLQLYFSFDGACSENSSSRFIKILCEVFEEKHTEWDILQMFTYVNKRLIDESNSNSDEKTLPQIVSTLTKFLKFDGTVNTIMEPK